MKKRVISLLLASALLITSVNMEAFATERSESGDEYKLVWSDEFDGDSLNRDNWNVELHEPGWVNSEKQAYVDSTDNIYVKDGYLHLQAKETTSAGSSCTAIEGNMLSNSTFSDGMTGWTETIGTWDDAQASSSVDASDASITYNITNVGKNDYDIQLKQTDLSLEAGKAYTASFYITSEVARSIKYGVMNNSDYTWYAGGDISLEADTETPVIFNFTMESGDDDVSYYISMGKCADDTAAGRIKISSLYLAEEGNVPASNAASQAGSSNMITNADFSSGMDGWTETIANWEGGPADASSSYSNGAITYSINNVGTDDWNVQLKQTGLSLENGKSYKGSFDINSSVARQIKSGLQDSEYHWFGGSDANLSVGDNTVSFDFTMDRDSEASFYISLGYCGGDNEAGEFTISNISLTEINEDQEDEEENDDEEPEENTETATAPRVTTVAGGSTTSSYTSGRISTQNLETFTYGRFEVRAKVPAGAGYLPAFWLMANDENVYGQWPRCGEIDCMEVMGQETAKTYGTIHYGNPHAQNQGTYTLTDGSFSDDFHTFTCDWEPGKITWYVDGVEYYTTSDWYSTTEGQGTLTYPAPFDQPFYIILNLAVGGSWVGDIDDSTSFDNNPYIIDYVRVYQKDSYDENVTAPVKELNLKEADEDGNYITNGDFSEDESLSDDESWKFLTANGGVGSATIQNNKINISTENYGTVDYSIQLVQAGLPFEKGATYQVQFDAYADSNRKMGIDIKAPDKGYVTYMDHQTAELTTTAQTYTYTFKMTSATDANGRLEFNMGYANSTAGIHISNVSVTKTAEADPTEVDAKTVLANGNYIYNGCFQEGTGHLGDWSVSADTGVDYAVTSFSDGRRFKATVPSGKSLTLAQSDLAFASGQSYCISMDIEAAKSGTATVNVGGLTKTLSLTAGKNTYSYKVNDASFTNNDFAIKLTGDNTYYVDNVSMTESALLKNGSFNDGLTGFSVYIDSSANASKVVDSLSEDNALDITINNTGDQDWKIQVKQENIALEKGKTYKLTLQAKSSIPRKMRVIMQGQEARGWSVYSDDNIIDLTDKFQTITDTFTMNEDTDLAAFFSICLGKIDEQITEQHRVVIDNISLVEVDTSVNEKPADNNKPVSNTVSSSSDSDDNSSSSDSTSSSDDSVAAINTLLNKKTAVVTPAVKPLPTVKVPVKASATTSASNNNSSSESADEDSQIPAIAPGADQGATNAQSSITEDKGAQAATDETAVTTADEDQADAEGNSPAIVRIFTHAVEAIKNFFLSIFNLFR